MGTHDRLFPLGQGGPPHLCVRHDGHGHGRQLRRSRSWSRELARDLRALSGIFALPDGVLPENMVLSNRDKSRHSDQRGLEGIAEVVDMAVENATAPLLASVIGVVSPSSVM